jgi:hypothetical protein
VDDTLQQIAQIEWRAAFALRWSHELIEESRMLRESTTDKVLTSRRAIAQSRELCQPAPAKPSVRWRA